VLKSTNIRKRLLSCCSSYRFR